MSLVAANHCEPVFLKLIHKHAQQRVIAFSRFCDHLGKQRNTFEIEFQVLEIRTANVACENNLAAPGLLETINNCSDLAEADNAPFEVFQCRLFKSLQAEHVYTLPCGDCILGDRNRQFTQASDKT